MKKAVLWLSEFGRVGVPSSSIGKEEGKKRCWDE